MNVWNLLFPDKCVLCGAVLTKKQRGLCCRCQTKLPFVKEPCCKHCGKGIASSVEEYCVDCSRRTKSCLDAGVALWEYTEDMRRLMAEFKYGGCEADAVFFADELMRTHGQKLRSWSVDGIVPVPLHWRKRWFRGYNQAESLAVEVGKRLNTPVWTDVIKRTRYTEPQKELDDKERLANLKNAFSACEYGSERLDGAVVLLVDDIYTTGATLEACARVLLEMGAKNVYFTCLCIGRDY